MKHRIECRHCKNTSSRDVDGIPLCSPHIRELGQIKAKWYDILVREDLK